MIRPDPIAPPFESRGQIVAFCVLVIFLLCLPLVLRELHLPSHRARMGTAPVLAGPYSFLQRQLHDETGDVDIVFAGASSLWVGIDTRAVSRGLTAALGRPVQALSLGWNWSGDDLPYHVVRDLLARRRVRHVVLRLPPEQRRSGPHAHAYRWLFGCEHDTVLPTLPLGDRVGVYGLEIVGGLRQLVSLLRPDLTAPSPYEPNLGAYPVERGPGGGPFRPLSLSAPTLPLAAVVTDVVAARGIVLDENQALGSYELGYARGLRDLLRAHGVQVTLLRLPRRFEIDQPALPVARYLPDLYGREAGIIAPAPAVLFQGIAPADIEQMYYDDDHFNRNGAAFFTAAVMPALIDLQRRAHAN